MDDGGLAGPTRPGDRVPPGQGAGAQNSGAAAQSGGAAARSPGPAARLVVGAAIVDSLDRPHLLLVARRSAPPELAGMWEFPGGKVDPGETAEQALHRELDEELGVRVDLGEELLPAEGSAAGADDPEHGRVWVLTPGLVLRLWLARMHGVPAPRLPTPREDHDELRWLRSDELGSVPWLPADAAAVEAVADRLHGRP